MIFVSGFSLGQKALQTKVKMKQIKYIHKYKYLIKK